MLREVNSGELVGKKQSKAWFTKGLVYLIRTYLVSGPSKVSATFRCIPFMDCL